MATMLADSLAAVREPWFPSSPEITRIFGFNKGATTQKRQGRKRGKGYNGGKVGG